ncbi:MAG TPA: hypothetical protein PKW56_08830 [Clostridiales bacterium]|nr:hypothetical protein [Clostridiales bacterium]
MNKKEHEEYRKALEKASKKILSSKEKALDFLIKAGIYDKDGKLSKHYRSDSK